MKKGKLWMVLLFTLVFALSITAQALADYDMPQKTTPNTQSIQKYSKTVMPMDPIPDSMQLSTSGYTNQPDNYTCGPGSAHNLLLNWGKNIATTQLEIDLQYGANGTPFTGTWTQTLNNYTNSSFYVALWTPSQSSIWTAFTYDTWQYGHPFILDTHMNSTNGYLVGYAAGGGDLWHYVTGNGYSGYTQGSDSNKYGAYFDQFNGRSGTYGEHQLVLTSWPSLLRERGIIY